MKTFNSLTLKNILALAIASTTSAAWAAFDAVDTSYTTDVQHYHVWNEALKPIELVNSILCFTGQFKANNFVNSGPYIALADEKACFKDEGGGDASSQSAGSANTPTYMKVIVNATRGTGPTDPVIIKVWMPEMGGGGKDGGSQSIKFKSVVSAGASDENPFGSFTFNYAMFDSFTAGNSLGGGEIKTVDIPNKIGFTLFENEVREGHTSEKSASVVMSTDRSSGIALTSNGDSGGGGGGPVQNNAFGLAFNASNVLLQTASTYANLPFKPDTPKDGSGTESCLSRTVFDEVVGRYDLYNVADGSRVELNSGLAFKYDSDGDSTFDSFGHVGYWGVWAEKPDALVNGATIQVETPGTHDTTTYTILKAPGRLIKNTVQQLTLGEAHGIDFSYWSPDAQPTYNNWIVQYLTTDDGVNTNGFYKTAGSQNGNQGPVVVPLQTPVLITLNAHESLQMNSQQLGGNIKFTQGDAFLIFFKQEFINGSETASGGLFADGAATLYCVDRCPVGTLGATELASWDSAYSPHVFDPANAIAFDINNTGANALALVRNSNSQIVKFADDVTDASLQASHSPNAWGVRSGSLVTHDILLTLTNSWDMYNPTIVTVFYEWETGLNSFNKTTSIKNANGVIQTFDKPIQISYIHSDANDRSGHGGAFSGKLFVLNYGGNGEFWGIPSVQDNNGRQHPNFNIKDGTVIGANNQYVVKAREVEGTMHADTGQCTSLTLTEPDAPVPSSITGAADIGDMPVVTSAPAVIGGVIQTP